jgi:hypothetical protein
MSVNCGQIKPNYVHPAEIERMARLHEQGPLARIPGYELSEPLVAQRVISLHTTQDNAAVPSALAGL